MVGASVYGLLGIDAQLERSAVAAQHQVIERHSVRVVAPRDQTWDCPGPAAEPRSNHRA